MELESVYVDRNNAEFLGPIYRAEPDQETTLIKQKQ